MMMHLQRIDFIDYKSRLIKSMNLELAALDLKQFANEVLLLENESL